jgi:hypothetical protein
MVTCICAGTADARWHEVRTPMKKTPSRLPSAIASGYALAGLTYIGWSDQALEALTSHNHVLYRVLQTWKGWGFIVVTALLLWIVLRSAFREVHQKMRDAQYAERRLRLALDAADGLVWTAVAQEGGFSVTVTGTIAAELGLDRLSTMDLSDIRCRIHSDDLGIFDSLLTGDKRSDVPKPQVICRILSISGVYRWL